MQHILVLFQLNYQKFVLAQHIKMCPFTLLFQLMCSICEHLITKNIFNS